jgi:hypothetical protein
MSTPHPPPLPPPPPPPTSDISASGPEAAASTSARAAAVPTSSATRHAPRHGRDGRVQRLFTAVAQGNIHVLRRDVDLMSMAAWGPQTTAIDVSTEVCPWPFTHHGVEARGLTLFQFARALTEAGHDREAVAAILPKAPPTASSVGHEAAVTSSSVDKRESVRQMASQPNGTCATFWCPFPTECFSIACV